MAARSAGRQAGGQHAQFPPQHEGDADARGIPGEPEMSVIPTKRPEKAPLVPDLAEPLPWLYKDDGLISWIGSTDHKQIGIMYMLTTLVFFLIGGLEALVMRLQLGAPDNHVVSPQAYDQLFTMH